MEIQSTGNIKPTKLNTLIYGASGTGKTTLLSTLPNKTLIISKESGLLSLKDFSIDYVEPKDLKELRSVLVSEEIDSYDNIAIDSLTEIASMFLEESTLLFPDDRQNFKKYGHYNEGIVRFIKFTRDLNKNIIFTSLEKTAEDNAGRRFTVPDITGSLASKLPAYFDFVFNLQIINKENERERVLLTQPFDGFICKDRSGKLEDYEVPNLSLIINKVFG